VATQTIISLVMTGLATLATVVGPYIATRRNSTAKQPAGSTAVPAGTPMPAQPSGAAPNVSHPILADFLAVGQTVLSQQGSAGLQQVTASLLAALNTPNPMQLPAGQTPPSPTVPPSVDWAALGQALQTLLQGFATASGASAAPLARPAAKAAA
jgi:hypothetical protein